MSNLTKHQEKAISAIKQVFSDVEVHIEDCGLVLVSFSNGEDRIMRRYTYQAKIGKLGRVIFFSATGFDADKKHQRVLASLAGYKLKEAQHYSFKVKLI